MGGKAPKLITTDEDASMRSAIASVFPDTVHRLCMWHIMEKVPEKVGPQTRNDKRPGQDESHMRADACETV
jgi:transposase-like protein